jgi:flagellar hook-associated protein 2
MGLRQSANGILDNTAGTGADKTDIDFNFETGKTSILAGKNAVAKIDGVDYYDLDKNYVTVNGVTYTFKNVTNAIDPTNPDTYQTLTDSNGNVVKDSNGDAVKVVKSSDSVSKVSVNINQDTATIVDKVKSFVEEYNSIMQKLYEWYDEKPNDNYKPLTATQKEGMKDEQIEKWEEKAKAGLLYHDKTLYSVINDMRSVIAENVEGITGKYNNIFALGISTSGTKGQLKLDEEQLNSALAEDPEAVYNVFSKLDKGETQYLVKLPNGKEVWTTDSSRGTAVTDSEGNPRTKTVERSTYNGIAQRLSDVLNAGLKNIREVSGTSADISEDSDLNNLMRELQTKISNFQTMMKAFEEALYKKYDAMESSLALLGAQLNYVTGAFQ